MDKSGGINDFLSGFNTSLKIRYMRAVECECIKDKINMFESIKECLIAMHEIGAECSGAYKALSHTNRKNRFCIDSSTCLYREASMAIFDLLGIAEQAIDEKIEECNMRGIEL